MVVQVMMADGTVKIVSVRYSGYKGHLFTTAAALAARGIVDPSKIEIASAPFDVYETPWNNSGWPEEDSYFSLDNLITCVPYGARGWNYL